MTEKKKVYIEEQLLFRAITAHFVSYFIVVFSYTVACSYFSSVSIQHVSVFFPNSNDKILIDIFFHLIFKMYHRSFTFSLGLGKQNISLFSFYHCYFVMMPFRQKTLSLSR